VVRPRQLQLCDGAPRLAGSAAKQARRVARARLKCVTSCVTIHAHEPISKIGTGMYRSADRGVTLLVWRNRNGIVDHVEAQQADRLRLDGHPLSAGYRAFRTILTREGWKSFGCGGGVRGLTLAGRFHSLTFVRWSRRGAWASISLASQPPVFGVCEGLSGPPPPVK